jgi:hypothetical protein
MLFQRQSLIRKAEPRALFSLDHLVRGTAPIAELSADLFCRLKIDHKLKLRGLLHGQVGRLGAFQNLVYVEQGHRATPKTFSSIITKI